MLGYSNAHDLTARREFLLAAGSLFLPACALMAQVEGTDVLLRHPTLEGSHEVLRKLVSTVLPFHHPEFPQVSDIEILARIDELFGLNSNPDFANFFKALMLFDDVHAFRSAPAPFVRDERRSLESLGLQSKEIDLVLEAAERADLSAFDAFRQQFATGSFVEQPSGARAAYLAMWQTSELRTRRAFYRGAKALIVVAAYSMKPFWDKVGYEGPLRQRV